jgi:hypothetical protein
MSVQTVLGWKAREEFIGKGPPIIPLILAKTENSLLFYAKTFYKGNSEAMPIKYNTFEKWAELFEIVTIEMELPDE